MWAHRYWTAAYWAARYWAGGIPAASTLTAEPGTFTLTGQDAITRTNKLVAQTGVFTLTGTAALTIVAGPDVPLPQEIPEEGGSGTVLVVRRTRRRW